MECDIKRWCYYLLMHSWKRAGSVQSISSCLGLPFIIVDRSSPTLQRPTIDVVDATTKQHYYSIFNIIHRCTTTSHSEKRYAHGMPLNYPAPTVAIQALYDRASGLLMRSYPVKDSPLNIRPVSWLVRVDRAYGYAVQAAQRGRYQGDISTKAIVSAS